MILLDTDIVTLLALGHERVAERVLASGDVVATSVITRIEILQGRFAFVLKARDGQELRRAQRLLDQSEWDLTKLVIVPIDVQAAEHFDRLRAQAKLKKIGRADLLVASIALAHRVTLVTRNTKHFRGVPGLMLENWAE